MITKQQVENAQNTWGDGVVKIGSLKDDDLHVKTLQINLLMIYMLLN